MWIIQEPKKVALWNKRHFEEKNRECAACLKYSVLIVVEEIYIKCNIWRAAVRPSYIWDARFLKVNGTFQTRHKWPSDSLCDQAVALSTRGWDTSVWLCHCSNTQLQNSVKHERHSFLVKLRISPVLVGASIEEKCLWRQCYACPTRYCSVCGLDTSGSSTVASVTAEGRRQ